MRLITTALLLALTVPAQAEVACPDSLEVQQQAVIRSEDWTAIYSDPPLRLTGVTIFNGPPSQNRKGQTFFHQKHAG